MKIIGNLDILFIGMVNWHSVNNSIREEPGAGWFMYLENIIKNSFRMKSETFLRGLRL